MMGINNLTNAKMIKINQVLTENSASGHHSIKLLLNLND